MTPLRSSAFERRHGSIRADSTKAAHANAWRCFAFFTTTLTTGLVQTDKNLVTDDACLGCAVFGATEPGAA
jgi:hypothetical protein